MTATPKAIVRKCGKIIPISETESILDGWHFDCRNEVAPFSLNDEGEPLMAGYTLDELREMAARPAEFEIPAEDVVEPLKCRQPSRLMRLLIVTAFMLGLHRLALWLHKPYMPKGSNCISNMPDGTPIP